MATSAVTDSPTTIYVVKDLDGLGELEALPVGPYVESIIFEESAMFKTMLAVKKNAVSYVWDDGIPY